MRLSRLARVIAVRPGEGRLVALVAGAFAVVEAGRGLGEVGVDTLVLTRFGASVLPSLYVGLGIVGLVVTLGYGVALTRSTSQRFFPSLLLALGGVLAVEWLVALSGVEAVYPLIWISVYAAGLLLLTAMWTVGGFSFDARQAKRLFPLLTSAAIVGSLAGFLSAIVVQRLIGAEFLILAEALLFLVAALLLSRLGPRIRPRRAPGEATLSVSAALTAGAAYVAASPLLRLVAVAYVLLAILMFSLTFPFMSAMSAAFPDESELLTMLALFSAAVTVVSFLAGTLLANRLNARFGVATVALALPAMYLLGFGLWIVRFTLLTAVLVRFAQQVTQRGFSNAAFSAFYNVIPSRRRGQVLAFMDGVPGQLGTILSGILLIIASSLALEQVFLMGLVTAILCVIVLVLIRRAYASSLVATLREGRGEQVLEGGAGLQSLARDAAVIAELRTAATSASTAERTLAADLLGRLGAKEATPEVRGLLDDADANTRRVAILSLARLGGHDTDDLLARARDDDDEQVRGAAIKALGQQVGLGPSDLEALARLSLDPGARVRCEIAIVLAGQARVDGARAIIDGLIGSADSIDKVAGFDAIARISQGIDAAAALAYFDDPAASVRAAAMRAAAVHDLGELGRYLACLDDPSLEVRTTAAHLIRDMRVAGPALIDILDSGSERAQEAALLGLHGHAPFVRARLLAWSELQVARATRLRGHAASLAGADESSTAAFLGQVIRRREAAIESGLLQALAALGAPEAGGLIRRCLYASDPEVRAQAIEALDALGDARLARGVVKLLDRQPEPDSATTVDVIVAATALIDDRDVWVRALALRTLSERLRDDQRSIAALVRSDPDPLIGQVVEIIEAEGAMAQSVQLVSDIDRMLILRHVSIFAALGPEDLQRVAAAAEERAWTEGEELMTEGDVGDELVVIVEGSVRVVHREAGGDHLLRTYGAGDHIGELAVLRVAPRAATVIAEASGVRGLVINGDAVHALLQERPEAAMAMLATLAERISQQG